MTLIRCSEGPRVGSVWSVWRISAAPRSQAARGSGATHGPRSEHFGNGSLGNAVTNWVAEKRTLTLPQPANCLTDVSRADSGLAWKKPRWPRAAMMTERSIKRRYTPRDNSISGAFQVFSIIHAWNSIGPTRGYDTRSICFEGVRGSSDCARFWSNACARMCSSTCS